MRTYHVHLYQVVKKFEVDVEAVNGEQAKAKAIGLWREKKLKEVPSDCKVITFTFENKGEVIGIKEK